MSDSKAERNEAKVEAAAAKARAKSMRPWYKKKRFVIPLILLVLIVIISVSSGGEDDEPTASNSSSNSESNSDESGNDDGEEPSDPTDTERQGLYPDRPDTQDSDHEAELGSAVRLSGYTATVTKAEMFTPEFGDPTFVIHVSVENRDDEAQPYNLFDWRIQTEGGQVLDPTFTIRDDDLGSGDLVKGGTVSGTVAFDVEPGTYYVIYKPDAFDDARGIWKVTA